MLQNQSPANGGASADNQSVPEAAPTNALLSTALEMHEHGFCVIPTHPGGGKKPHSAWKEYQYKPPSRQQVQAWFSGETYSGLGIVCGSGAGTSTRGAVLMLELEGRAVTEGCWEKIVALCAEHGLSDLWKNITAGWCEMTPSGGIHIYFRVLTIGPMDGNKRLASRPATEAELASDPGQKQYVLIETRATGGFSVCAPSNGVTHETGKPWTIVSGGPATIATITMPQQDKLLRLLQTLDSMPVAPSTTPPSAVSAATPAGAAGAGDLRPGDDYRARTTWAEILEPSGWVIDKVAGDGRTHWRRPGNPTVGTTSATTIDDVLYVFTTSTTFEAEKTYNRFGAYTVLNHSGDFSAAARALRELGYGSSSAVSEQVFTADVSVEEFRKQFPHTVGCEYGDTQLRDYMGRLAMATMIGKRTALLRDTVIPKVFALVKAGCLGSSAVESLSTWVAEILEAGGEDVGPVMKLAVANTVAKTSCPTHAPRPETKMSGDSAATELADLASERYEFGVSSDDEAFAIPKTGPRIVRLLRGGKNGLRPELSKLYRKETGRVAPQQALADALLALEGDARDTDPVELHLRVAWHEGAIYLDLGDVSGRVVRISPSGWSVQDDSPILFKRTALTGVLPEPVRGGDLDELWGRINVKVDDRAMLLGYLVAALIPDIPHPVLSLQGEQGTGKTTATKTCVALIDPSPVPLRKPPKEADGWVTAAAGSWVVALDNVSGITPWLSDSICRAVTGDGDVRRKLYTDGDLAVFAFRRVILLNGIDLGALRGDLSERLLAINLERIPNKSRLEDAELANAWEDEHPRVLGALLTLASEVLAVRPDVHLDESPRMADFARILASVDQVKGTKSLAQYLNQSKDLNADSVTSEPAIAAMIEKVTGSAGYTSKELLALITPADKTRDWPNARRLTGLLKRHAPALRGLGWTIEQTTEKRHNAVVWEIAPPNDDEPNGDGEKQRATELRPREDGKLPTQPTLLPESPLSPPKRVGGEIGEVVSAPLQDEAPLLSVLCITCDEPLEPHLVAQNLTRHPLSYRCAA